MYVCTCAYVCVNTHMCTHVCVCVYIYVHKMCKMYIMKEGSAEDDNFILYFLQWK